MESKVATKEQWLVTREQWLLVDFFEDSDYVERALKGMHRYHKGIPGVSLEELVQMRENYLNNNKVDSNVA